MDNMGQFNEVFFEEAQEHLETMETLLLDYDIVAPDIEVLNSVFRAAHSIKGGSGIFGFTAMTGLIHVMENMLDLARNEELHLTNELITVLLETVDVLKDILDRYRNEEEIDWEEVESSKARLETVLNSATASDSPATSPSATDSATDEGFGFFDDDEEDEGFGFFDDLDEPVSATSDDEIEGFGFFEDDDSEVATSVPSDNSDEEIEGFGFFDDLEPPTNNTIVKSSVDSNAQVSAPNVSQPEQTTDRDGFGFFDETLKARHEQDIEDNARGYGFFKEGAQESNNSKKHESSAASTNPAVVAKSSVSSERKAKSSSEHKHTEATSIRVETNKIDKLVNLVGELVITQSMLNLIGNDVHDAIADKMQAALAELERNTREIQEAVMSVRMLPISFVFNRFPRLVRDLSVKMSKDIELVIEGGGTEIDKNLVEKISDPLTHLIRNSVDHGIEMPDVRVANGKPAKGTVRLTAAQKGGEIVISILDDGAGLNWDKIVAKAEEKGVELPEPLTDEAVWQLIFAPGFSTAAEVTDVSGRGVGMDVVRRNIESLGGRVEINSSPGLGTEFVINLPLTLAILDGMCVDANEQIFVVPLVNIVESIQPAADQVRVIKGSRILYVREEYWPLVDVGKVLGDRDANVADLTQAIVVLVETSKSRFGLVVDNLVGQQQVVIKSLERHYRRVEGVAGATIMGDGSVALILDVDSLTQFISFDQGDQTYGIRAAG
ncbi:chemotaxis protein CheA [Maribrevibacterium harenarium]|uniref:Chemotaxis protein CheA n=1 Tax=Maribrevibacterium harenarium TaxID=2589817 RepID=A0A501WRT2_9GAMM|nr:chemotaxis protein CheA [Maribrevibacterium harenarium]TPE51542.1 chemotaxis protein CheA [Maribrevibacterium harenarium]